MLVSDRWKNECAKAEAGGSQGMVSRVMAALLLGAPFVKFMEPFRTRECQIVLLQGANKWRREDLGLTSEQ